MSEFVEWLTAHLWAGWGLLAVGLAAAELFTLDMTLLMLAAGALAGGLVALVFPALVWLQVAIALATAVATLFLLRPTLLERVRRAPGYRSSLDTLIGASCVATTAITATTGEVKVEGQVWEARSYDSSVEIAAGENVEVLGLDGITLLVYPANRPLGR
ncbi:MAG: NfeD family protein [Arachnia sp.]